MFTTPEFFNAKRVQVRSQGEVAAELQHRVLTNRMMGREKGAEA